LPRWINQYIIEAHSNMSTDMAISLSKKFIRQISQPFDHTQTGISLWTLEDIEDKQRKDEEERERAAREYGDAFGTIRTPAAGMGDGGFTVDAMDMDRPFEMGVRVDRDGGGDGVPDEDELKRMEQYEKEMEEAAGMQVDEDMDMGLTDEALAGVDMP
jgi:DNA excision repair protein ERCC-2